MSWQSSDRRRLLVDRRMCVRLASVTMTACQRRRPISTSSVSPARSAPSSTDSTSRSHSPTATSSTSASWSSEHQVVFARDQHLDEEQHRTLASQFGALSIHPVGRLTGSGRAISVIDDTADRPPAGFDWHTDLSWTVEPPDLGFLSAVVIPPCGGDTLWASGRAIYERLDPARQRLCRSLRVVHVPDDTLLNTVRRHHGEDIVRRLIAEHPPIEQPLVRLHAETGRPAMWLSPLYAAKVVGLDDADSRRVLRRSPSPDPRPGGAGSVAVGRRRRRHLGRDQHLPPGPDRSRAATAHHASLHDHRRPTGRR